MKFIHLSNLLIKKIDSNYIGLDGFIYLRNQNWY